jgi:Arc/MetJ-type ribon-helix-helix transcriptional regulator
MREILNISLPKEMVVQIKKGVKEGGFSTTSEYMRHLIRLENTRRLVEEIEISRQEFKNGKGKLLKSLKDLR